MEFNYICIWVIYLLVFILMLFIIKTIFKTLHLKYVATKNYLVLEENFQLEYKKLEYNNHKVQLLEDLHQTLFNRLFKITRDIILMQKLIFEMHTSK